MLPSPAATAQSIPSDSHVYWCVNHRCVYCYFRQLGSCRRCDLQESFLVHCPHPCAAPRQLRCRLRRLIRQYSGMHNRQATRRDIRVSDMPGPVNDSTKAHRWACPRFDKGIQVAAVPQVVPEQAVAVESSTAPAKSEEPSTGLNPRRNCARVCGRACACACVRFCVSECASRRKYLSKIQQRIDDFIPGDHGDCLSHHPCVSISPISRRWRIAF